jgi:hypothetical protein
MPPRLPRSLTVKPVKLQGQLEETFYKKSDDGRHYRHEGNADLWLIETKDGRRGTLSMPRRGQGWMYDRNTTWLTNSPREATPMAKAKRRPPKGFKSWKTYMASIRPNGKRRASNPRKRKAAKRARPRSSVVIVNPPKKRRHVARRRNPPDLGAYIKDGGLMIVHGAIGGTVIVATEAGTRLIRKRVLGMTAGTLLAGAAELGISTTAGLLAHHLLPEPMGERAGQLIVDAGFASVIRATVKQSSAPWVSDALADDGPQKMFIVRNNRVVRRSAMGGYVSGATTPARLNGYVPGASSRPALGGYVPGNGSAEIAAATADLMR